MDGVHGFTLAKWHAGQTIEILSILEDVISDTCGPVDDTPNYSE
jgi:hypothetical protein